MSIKGKCKAVLYGSALSFGMGYVLGGLRYGNGPLSLSLRPIWPKIDELFLPIVFGVLGIVVFAIFMAILTRLIEALWRRTHRMP